MGKGIFNAGGGMRVKGSDISYDNSKSLHDATNIQDALDEAWDTVLPRIAIYVEAGSTIVVTDNKNTYEHIVETDEPFVQLIPKLGVWTITATKNDNTVSETVNVATLGETYSLRLSYFSFALTVKSSIGAVIDISNSHGESLPKVSIGSDGTAVINVKQADTYTLYALYGDLTTPKKEVVISENGSSLSLNLDFRVIKVVTEPESSVTAVSGGTTLKDTANENGLVLFHLPFEGTWKVTATRNDQMIDAKVEVTEWKTYVLDLAYALVFGVC